MTWALVTFALLLASFAFLVYGAWLVYPPAGWLVAGMFLWVDAYMTRRSKDGAS